MVVANEVITIGCQVELELAGEEETERLVLRLVPDEQADFYGGFLGVHTPLGQAIIGQTVGAQAAVGGQDGLKVTIVAISSVENSLQEARQNAARRQEELDQTRRQIQRTNAIVFSTTVEGKWGEYDTDGIEEW